jgi:uncharacterized MnhB-related membrane protein
VVAMLPVICLFVVTRKKLLDSVMLSGGGIVG